MSAEPEAMTPPPPDETPAPPARVYRHRLPVRIGHWINALALTVLLFSGLQIFNAHPRLYWGQAGSNAPAAIEQPFFAMSAELDVKGLPHGFVQIGQARIETTGVFGVSQRADGSTTYRGFPRWLTLPGYTDLAGGRRWHFFFAWLFVLNGLAYLAWSFLSRHVQRDLWPTGADLKGVGRSIVDHLRLRHPTGAAAARYNVLQKLAYVAVIFVLLPMMVATGLTMSPGIGAAAPWLLDLFGGRQSARSLHFITVALLVLFVIVHLVETVLAGPVNELRSIITGWYVLPRAKKEGDAA